MRDRTFRQLYDLPEEILSLSIDAANTGIKEELGALGFACDRCLDKVEIETLSAVDVHSVRDLSVLTMGELLNRVDQQASYGFEFELAVGSFFTAFTAVAKLPATV